jgi:hypothetical protein
VQAAEEARSEASAAVEFAIVLKVEVARLEASAAVELAIETSAAKSQQLITSTQKLSEKKVATITRLAKK